MDALVNVAVPVFAIVVLGYLAGWFGILAGESAMALNRFVYYFALPPVLFVFTARAPIEKVLYWPFIAAFLGGSILTLLVALLLGRLWFRHDLAKLSLLGLSAVFSNTAYMGIPLFLAAYGPQGALPAIVATLAANTLFIGGAIACLETAKAKGTSSLSAATHVGGSLIKNPLLVAPVLGVLFSNFALPVPKPVGNFLDLMAAAAGPAALFALGLSLVGRELRGDWIEIAWVVALKLVVHPVATLLLVTYVFVMEPFWSRAAVILAALPVGALVFVVAQQYDVYVQRASTSIIVSTALSVVTVSMLLIWFQST